MTSDSTPRAGAWEGFRRWIHRLMMNTYNHFRCYLPAGAGGMAGFMMRFLFSKIRIPQDQSAVVRGIPEGAIIVYVHKYKSYFEYLFYHTRYQKEGLPVPEIGFDYKFLLIQPVSRMFRILLANTIYLLKRFSFNSPYETGYIREMLQNGKAGMCYLVEKGGFYLRFVKSNPDPLRYLINMQKEIDRPIYIVPQLMFFSKKPHRATPSLIDIFFGSEENPGKFRRLFAVSSKPETIFVEISEPIHLQRFIHLQQTGEIPDDEMALQLRREILDQINRHRQSITGPVLKTHEELKEEILTHDHLRSYLASYAETRNTSIPKAYKEADEYIDEIAARYSINWIKIFSMIVKWLIQLMFDGVSINTEMLNRVKSASRKGSLVLVPCHKSHIDYLILSYILYNHDMPCPHIAAGKNLSFWPLGPIFRGGGAFFIRRTFKGAVLYAKVFSEYVRKLLEEGFNIEFFMEGGRSRTGKLLQPKLGFLSILLSAYRLGASRDLMFVPVFIGYDRVLEESSYLHELEGGQKKPESLSQVIQARKLVKKRYGRIYIRFHEPMSLKDILARKGSDLKDMSPKEQNVFCRQLGHRIMSAIDRVTVITPHAVMAGAILNSGKTRFSYDHILADIETYMTYLNFQKASLADTLLMDSESAFEHVFSAYVHRKFVEPVQDHREAPLDEREFLINPAKRPALDYYKNNCIIQFVPAAFTALAVLERDAFQFSGSDLYETYRFLQHFFEYEFSYDMERSPESHVHKNIKAFIDDAIVIPHPTLPDTYNITSAGFRKLKLFASFLTTYFESYWVALSFFTRYPKNFVDAKDRLKKIQSMGHRMLKKMEISRGEAVSRINFKNAMDFFNANGVKGSEDEEAIRRWAEKIRRYLEILQS